MTFDKWWAYYRGLKRLTHNIPGVRSKAEAAWNKLGLDQNHKESERIYNNTLELARYDLSRLDKGEKIDRWPHGSTFINQGYFDREIDSYEEIKERRFCHCGEEAHGNLEQCAYHYSMEHGSLTTELREFYKKHFKKQEHETQIEYNQRMRTAARVYLNKLTATF